MRSSAGAEVKALFPIIERWDTALADLGRDPSRERWEAFRPLRLSREEDWSDWLAYLLGTSEGKTIAARLFGPGTDSAELENVRREVPVAGGDRRADLLLLWSGARASHVEVKLWDTCYGKTCETGNACRAAFPGHSGWRDYVLLPDEMKEGWKDSAGTEGIGVVTWGTIAVELRRGLLVPGLSGHWRAFARAYCGAVEQRILGIPPLDDFNKGHARAAVYRFGRILREASDGT